MRFFCCPFIAFLSNAFCQLHNVNFYAPPFALPSSVGPEFGPPRPVLYAKSLWPFPSSFGSSFADPSIAYQYPQNSAAGAFAPAPSHFQNLPIWPPPPQPRHNQPIGLNELIAQLSLSIVRSLAQILTEREMGAAEGIGGTVPRHEAKAEKDLDTPLEGTAAAENGEQQRNSEEGKSRRRIENGQIPVVQSNTKYDYGLKAGLFVGHYGTSESIVSPLGPYGPLNSQIGGSYGGLSQWPIVFGRDLRRPQPSKSANGAIRTKSMQMPTTTEWQRQTKRQNWGGTGGAASTPAQVKGEGTVVQIPLGENIQGGDGGGREMGENE
ncbi:hypothetical protein niasHS_003881 [Heterodera schachtii]|uniref:Uncharacterized protein n=1 Tax=Heterodera schachtii TaxID=97005 RepID=A0ABD2K403_HETSC